MNAAYSCTDEGSGVATCTGTVANGSAINTATVGWKTSKSYAGSCKTLLLNLGNDTSRTAAFQFK